MVWSREPTQLPQQDWGDLQEKLAREITRQRQARPDATVRNCADLAFDLIDLFGPTIGAALAWTGAPAFSAAMLVYIWLRLEWHFAASSIVVLALDVTRTFGIIAGFGWEVNLTTIVALLTLIGYSVNHKVVVFDRTRENLSRVRKAGFGAVVDRSLNQVLARCTFTSGTTLGALVAMAIWGGPTVAGFALPMIAGVVIATASSIFVT